MSIYHEKIEKDVLVCKHDDMIFHDIHNKTGSLTKHLNVLSVRFKKNEIFDHFEKKRISHFVLKCPLCEFRTPDLENKSGVFTRHLLSYHNESIDSFCNKFNDYIPLWNTHFNNHKNELFLNKSENNKIKCEICGKFYKKITNKHLKKHDISPTEYKQRFNLSSTCSLTTLEKQRTISYDSQFDDVINRIHSYNITPLFSKSEYNGVDIKHMYNFKCNICDYIFKDHLDNGREVTCRICNPKLKFTPNKKIESEIYEFLQSINITDIITNDRSVISPKEIDFYIPSKNIAIECNGVYWHSELYKNKNYHLDKTLNLKNKGIRTIHIFDDEWNLQRNIIQSKLKQILNCNLNQKIYARKCKIKQISSKMCSVFLKENHIQGNDNSNIKLGAFYEDTLVSAMTFCKPRISLGYKNKNQNGIFELSRFCSNINMNVIGCAGKLLKYFITNYHPKSIITYADLRFTDFEKNIYTTLNFEKISKTEPNYFWCKSGKRHHRFNFTKYKLVKEGNDPKMTEIQIMHSNKYYRIWDCGHLKYKLDICNSI
jgi:hypothetical protein